MDVIQYAVQYPICWPLGRTAKKRSQSRNSCKMRAYFWPWLVLSLADVIILFCSKVVGILNIALRYFNLK